MTVFLFLFLSLLLSTQSLQLATAGTCGLISVRLFRRGLTRRFR